MNKLGQLGEALRAVCPIHGFSLDGRIDYAPEATEQQKVAAQHAFDTFVEQPEEARLTGEDVLAMLKGKGLVNDADISKARGEKAR